MTPSSNNDDKYSKTIFDCIGNASVDDLENIVKRGASINQIDKNRDKFTPLHHACYYGSLECLHWLLWQGADTTLTTPKGWTAAHVAAIRGQYACIQALIKNGVNMNVRDHRGQTPAHLAATHGHSHTLQAILRSGADVNMQDANGWTPVHSASYHGRLGCLQFLKTSGGRLDDCDNDGNTPAHLSAMEGHLPCLKYLLSNAANTNSLVTARNDQGDTPKTLAQQFFKDQVVEYLEAVEWDRDHPEQAENLAFPAHVAAFNGDIDHIKLLVEQGVININERDDKGSTIAHKAAGQGHVHILQWLIENGADLKITNQAGETARDVAKRFAHLACVKILETDADSDIENGYEKSDINAFTEAKDPILLSAQQKKDAKTRARKRLEDIEKQLNIARSNYLQLGGRLEDVISNEMRNEQMALKTINELKNELELERLRREKLEFQLDNTRQELEKSIKSLRDYESKVLILERYIQHTNKNDYKEEKQKKKKESNRNVSSAKSRPKSSTRQRQPSSSSNTNYNDETAKITSGYTINRKNSKSYSDSNFKNSTKNYMNNLTSSQLKELRRAFDEIDRNGSGSVSRKELRQAFRDLDIRASDDEIEVVINQMDYNDDGKIDFDEFCRVMSRNYYRRHTKDEIIDAFKKYDLNNSGAITADELQVVLSKMHRFVSREQCQELIRKVDKNKDGLIQIDEFAEMLELD